MNPVYFDYAATTPVDPRVIEAMAPFWFERFGNASSPHAIGRKARQSLEDARTTLAQFINAKPAEIFFTASASESNNQALLNAARGRCHVGRHIIVGAIEHHSILKPAERLAQDGYEISYCLPDAQGRIDPKKIESMLRPDTILVAVAHANNEIGTIQPIEDIGLLCQARNILFCVDAVQTMGHIPVDVKTMNCDYLSASAHKMYGPCGIGLLYVRAQAPHEAIILGGDQERGMRAGTVHMAAAVGFAAAARLCQHEMAGQAERETAWRDQIIRGVLSQVKSATLNGHPTKRLPNNVHFSFENTDGEELVAMLDMAGYCVSMGSACTWGKLEPSHVLRAIGLSDRQALSSLRISLGRFVDPQTITEFINLLCRTVSR